MALTLSQAVEQVRSRLDEASATVWSDVELMTWINEACAEIARRTESLQTVQSIDVSAGASMITMPPDVLRVSRVEWFTSLVPAVNRSLEIREKFAMDAVWGAGSLQTQGVPQYCAFVGFPPNLECQIYPLPEADGTLEVTYYKAAPTLATDGSDNDTVLTIPAGWEDLILDYATAMAQRRDGNAAWQDTRSVFEAKMGQMWDMVQFFHNQSGQITPDPHGFEIDYGYW